MRAAQASVTADGTHPERQREAREELAKRVVIAPSQCLIDEDRICSHGAHHHLRSVERPRANDGRIEGRADERLPHVVLETIVFRDQ